MSIFFTSDTHFGHYNVIKYCNRPFANAYEMDHALIENWNSVVNSNDIVYHLGDFAMNKAFVPKILPKLNGTKMLICGNHDACFKEVYGISSNLAKPKTKFYLNAGFTAIYKNLWMNIQEVPVYLNHFTYRNLHMSEERYHEYRSIDNGSWLLHGHQHNPPDKRLRNRMIDVGVDAWDYKPVSLETICDIM